MSRSKNQFFKRTTLKQALKMGPRRFVKEYLFPAMRREHGNGFAMAVWRRDIRADGFDGLDDLYNRQAPTCNSVMCIGGTMVAIVGTDNEEMLAKILRLPLDDRGSEDDAKALFSKWQSNFGPWYGLSQAFKDAKTPQQKERIAEKAVMAAIKIGERLKAEK